MANRAAPALVLRESDLEQLTRSARSSSVAAGLAHRSRIVFLAAEGVANETTAERVGVAPAKSEMPAHLTGSRARGRSEVSSSG